MLPKGGKFGVPRVVNGGLDCPAVAANGSPHPCTEKVPPAPDVRSLLAPGRSSLCILVDTGVHWGAIVPIFWHRLHISVLRKHAQPDVQESATE